MEKIILCNHLVKYQVSTDVLVCSSLVKVELILSVLYTAG